MIMSPGRPRTPRAISTDRSASAAWASAGERGQASIEFMTMLPILVAATVLIAGFLAGYGAREAADQAAVAGAIAHLQGGDVDEAIEAASPGWGKATVKVGQGRITVTMKPNLPRFAAEQVDARRTVVFDTSARP